MIKGNFNNKFRRTHYPGKITAVNIQVYIGNAIEMKSILALLLQLRVISPIYAQGEIQ